MMRCHPCAERSGAGYATWQVPHSADQRALGGAAMRLSAIAWCATRMAARGPIARAAMAKVRRLGMLCICRLLFQGHEVLHDVALFLRRAGACEHVVAVAPEPLVDRGGVGEALRVRGRGERRDRLAGAGVPALCQ